MPGGELTLEPPPEPERIVPAGVLQRMLPLVMLVGSVGFIAVLGVREPTSWLFGGMFAISTLGMLLTGAAAAGAAGRPASTRTAATTCATCRCSGGGCGASRPSSGLRWSGRTRSRRHGPRYSRAGRLWERRPADPDFGHVRVGRGAQRLATRLVPPQTGPVEGLEPVTALALRRFLLSHAVVPDLPVALSLRASGDGLARTGGRGRAGSRAGAGPRRRGPVRALARPGRRPARGRGAAVARSRSGSG